MPGSLPNSNRCGLNLVEVCDVALYCRKNWYISCFQFLCSTTADRIAFMSGLLKPSACALPHGQHSVTLLWWNPLCLANEANASELNGAPLSYLMTSRYPNVARCLSRTGITVFADTDRIISTMGNLEYSSTSTMSSSPEGSGPRKSIPRLRQACQTSALAPGVVCYFVYTDKRNNVGQRSPLYHSSVGTKLLTSKVPWF